MHHSRYEPKARARALRSRRGLSSRSLLACTGTVLAAFALASAGQDRASEPPTRALLLEFTRRPRLAGTPESLWAADFVERELRAAGLAVERDDREVLLSLPRRLEIEALAASGEAERVFWRDERYEPDANPPGDVPPYLAWSASGAARGPVIDAGLGLAADFERLVAAGVELRGTVALMRYGGAYRGVKTELAERHGCVAALLFNDPARENPEGGAVYPRGPFKPDWAVERGSILAMARGPGDPTTPGWASPAPGAAARRLAGEELDARLPRIPCLPIPWREARALLERLEGHELENAPAGAPPRRIGPGPVEVRLELDVPRELRRIRNVFGRIEGRGPELVLAGNHRDAWVRGANDAGSGTVALLRAAQHLGARVRAGWQPQASILLCFWDAEESGLIGSTEWGEAHGADLVQRAVAYVNADTLVNGTAFRGASGSPGLLGALRRALARVSPIDLEAGPLEGPAPTLWHQWQRAAHPNDPRLSLPGSGSDHAVFLHHLAIPVLDLGFSGARGGQYHTSFDDFGQVARRIDPTFEGHETAALLVAELLVELAEAGAASFDEVEAARELARIAREEERWLGADRAALLADVFEGLAERLAKPGTAAPLGERRFYAHFALKDGLPGRPWYRHSLWSVDLASGYGSERFPLLRAAAKNGDEELDDAVARLSAAVKILGLLRSPDEWTERPGAPGGSER